MSTLTGDESALLRGIRDDPDDDVRRLVYADWLEENGRAEHAELIRVQLALEKGPRKKKDLEQREEALIGRLRATWPASIADAGVIYRRGLGVARWQGFAGFEEGARRLVAAGPPPWVVECELKIEAYGRQDSDFRELAGSPNFALLTRLEIDWSEFLTLETAQAIGSSPHAAGLRDLTLHRMNLGDKGAAALAKGALRGLRRLDLAGSALGAKGVARIANSATFGELLHLSLPWCVEDEASLVALTQATGLPRLRVLYLTGNKIGDARLRRLLKSPILAHLEELVLAGNTIRDNGAKALAACAALAGLRSLNLNGNQIGEAGAQALLESPHLTSLEEIDLQWQLKISQETLGRLHKRFRGRKRKAARVLPIPFRGVQ